MFYQHHHRKKAPMHPRKRHTLAHTACALLFATPVASSAHAAITATGDVTPANPATWWLTNPSARIGNTASGALTVDGGSSVSCNSADLGYSNTGSGFVSIDGKG